MEMYLRLRKQLKMIKQYNKQMVLGNERVQISKDNKLWYK